MRRALHRASRRFAMLFAVASIASIACAAVGATAHADTPLTDNASERARLEEKRAELATRLDRIDVVARSHGTYVRLRDGDLLGDGGVAPRATAFYTATSAWMSDWTVTLAILDRVDDLAKPAVRADLLARIAKNEAAWQKLRTDAYELVKRAQSLDDVVRAEAPLGRTTVPAYAAQTEALDVQRDKLHLAAVQAAQVSSSTAMKRWADLSTLSERLVRLRIGQALSRSPALAEALKAVEEMYRAERITAPLIESFSRTYETTRATINAYHPFAAEARVAELHAAATNTRAAIAAAHLDARYTRDALAYLDGTERAGQQLFDEAIGPYDAASLLHTAFRDSGYVVSAKCRDAKARATVNCELFRQVYAVPADTIDRMTNDELRFFEETMVKVAQPAPIAGGT